MKKLSFFVLIALVAGMFLIPHFVFCADNNQAQIEDLNQQIEAKQNKIKELEKSIEEYKKKISQKQLEAVSFSNQVAILNNRISQLQLDIQATEEKLNSLNLEMQALNLTINDKEKTIDKQKKILSRLIWSLYQTDSKSYIEIAATYDNFSDFYNQLQYLKTIESDLGKSVKGLRLAKTDLEDKKVQLDERKKAYENLRETLQGEKDELEEEKFVKKDILTKTKASELVFKTMLSNLRQQYQDIESEIASIEREIRRRLEKQDKLQLLETGAGKFAWPVQSHVITTYFYDPDYPYRYIFEHNGLDIRAGQGTAVRAGASGYVARAKRCSSASCYSYVMLVHADGLATVYGHLSQIAVQEDQFVARGDLIGYSGGTPGTVGAGPFVTGPHLHFEVRKNGIPVNPLNYLNQ